MRPLRTSLPALACALLLAACGGGSNPPAATPAESAAPADAGVIRKDPANAAVDLVIGSKNFVEQEVLGQLYAQGLSAAGFKVRTRLDIGNQDAALKALKGGRIDAYPEYTGTALVAFFGMKARAVPRDPRQAYERARQGFAAVAPALVALPPTPFTSSNEVAVTRATAQRLGLKRISDLRGRAQRLTLYGSPECRTRRDCLRGLQTVYGLRFKRFVPVAVARRHQVLRDGTADVSIVFTTDPEIGREHEVLLTDDYGMFPPNNATLVVRQDVADRAGPDLERVVALLQEQLTAENMQELNARVVLDHKSPAEVAHEYLQETGLLVAG
jgi:osmoprotectant transport system substrate-binding protein